MSGGVGRRERGWGKEGGGFRELAMPDHTHPHIRQHLATEVVPLLARGVILHLAGLANVRECCERGVGARYEREADMRMNVCVRGGGGGGVEWVP